MQKEVWKQLHKKLQKFSPEERIKQLQSLLKKEKDKKTKKELQVLLSQTQQLKVAQDWQDQDLIKIEAIQLAEQPSQVGIQEEQAESLHLAETLEEVLETIPISLNPTLTETTIAYSPSSQYVPGVNYSPAISYSSNQYAAQDNVATQVMNEQLGSVQAREKEEEKERAVGSQKQSLETQEFTQYKSSKKQRKP